MSFLIFFFRIADVTLGTIRVIYLSKGAKTIAPVLGFFEVLIWVIAAQQIFTNLSNPIYLVMYSLGFAAGTYVGMWVEEKTNKGKVMLRIITKKDAIELESKINDMRITVTVIDGVGSSGNRDNQLYVPYNVKILYVAVRKKNIEKVLDILKVYDENAHYTIEDLRYATDDYDDITSVKDSRFYSFGFFRKGK